MKQVTLRLDAYGADARRCVAGAQQLADRRKHSRVEPIHLWYELVDSSEQTQAALRLTGTDPVDGIADVAARCTEGDVEYTEVYHEVYKLESFHRAAHPSRVFRRRMTPN